MSGNWGNHQNFFVSFIFFWLDFIQPGHRQTLAAAPKEAAECRGEEGGKFESQVSLSLDLVNRKPDKKILDSGMLDEPRMRSWGEVQGEVVEKKLYFKKSFMRGLTAMGGKLVNEIRNESGARVDINSSPGSEETVVLKGPLLLVENAERMLMELQSSVLVINLGYEEKNILVAGGKGCLMNKLRTRLQVPVSLEGIKLVLIGKPENTKREREVLKEELRRILKEPVRVEVPEGHEVKKLTLDKTFTKALTSNGGKLVNEIQYRSGAKVDIVTSPGIKQIVVLKGPAVSVEIAEKMLSELVSSAQEVSLSYEERTALLSGGKGCLLEKLQVMLPVAASIEGRKLVLFGKSEDSKKAVEMIEEELRKTLAC